MKYILILLIFLAGGFVYAVSSAVQNAVQQAGREERSL